MSFVLLHVPDDSPLERIVYGDKPLVIAEGPRHPFACVMGATEQEIGLFLRPLLPRIPS